MNNRQLYRIIALIVVIISASLLHAAYTSGQWREFAISEFAVFFAALGSAFLLRRDVESEAEEPRN